MLGGGALLLMADSADCPDGYSAAKYDATFKSTCPVSLVPETGTVHIDLKASNSAGGIGDGTGLERDLRAAGFNINRASVNTSGGGDTCSQSGFSFEMSGPRYCRLVNFALAEQTVTCSRNTVSPYALRLGRRDLSDGAVGDAETSDASSEDASSSTDASFPFDPSTPVDDAAAPTTAPLEPPVDCTITFAKVK